MFMRFQLVLLFSSWIKKNRQNYCTLTVTISVKAANSSTLLCVCLFRSPFCINRDKAFQIVFTFYIVKLVVLISQCFNTTILFFLLSMFLFLFHSLFQFPEAGCENGCSRHGQCTLEDGEYKCVCIEGWSGPDCSIQLEMNCNDNIDNDHGKFIALVLAQHLYFE